MKNFISTLVFISATIFGSASAKAETIRLTEQIGSSEIPVVTCLVTGCVQGTIAEQEVVTESYADKVAESLPSGYHARLREQSRSRAVEYAQASGIDPAVVLARMDARESGQPTTSLAEVEQEEEEHGVIAGADEEEEGEC
jgi:hypothetical protein